MIRFVRLKFVRTRNGLCSLCICCLNCRRSSVLPNFWLRNRVSIELTVHVYVMMSRQTDMTI